MNTYPFDFSVVMAVYNVENYLREAVHSLVHQTIGFSRIQVILVDDGSTDKSGKICDEYGKKYPDNVVVVHKENGRQASARNAGLPYAKGRYVNFLDPDDTLEKDAMKKVKAFMDTHPETDVCAIPIFFCGDQRGPHMLNGKFEQGTRVVELLDEENADCLLLSVAASFYRSEAARKMSFDTELFHAEDAKENVKVLLENPKLGIVADTAYNYRKYGDSTLNQSIYRKESYILYLEHFSAWALEQAKERYGFIPKFIQNIIMYDIQWKWNQASVPRGVLTAEEEDRYKALLIKITSQIDDDVILGLKHMNAERKCHVLRKKYGEAADFRLRKVVSRKESNSHKSSKQGDIYLYIQDCLAAKVSEMDTRLEFLTIDKNNCCTMEGHHHIYGLEDVDLKPVVLVNGETIPGETIERPRNGLTTLGEKTSRTIGFRCRWPLGNKKTVIVAGLMVGHLVIPRRNIGFGRFFPVTNTYQYSYALLRNTEVETNKGSILLRKKPNFCAIGVRENRLLSEIWKKDLTGGRKAVAGRLFYHLARPFKHKELWIISDRIMKADDNGEALFSYLQEHKPENVNILFAISKESPDYERLRQMGRCINAMKFQHKLLHLLADVVISSHADGITRNPYLGYDDALRDMLLHQKYVFLQHGITKDDISGWINRYNQNMDGVVTAAIPERESMLQGGYYYPENRIWLTGFPRYDRLYHDEKKKITIMPTWRRYLMGISNVKTGTWTLPKEFEESSYYRFYNQLLNSDRLLKICEEYGYTLQFMPHPTLQLHLNRFDHDPRVKFLSLDTSYREVYAESNIVLTDYSSAVFDFAYLKKPVIYCHFDSNEIFGGEHVFTKGYFDYERDGFGEVTYSLQETEDLLVDYIRNGCQMKEQYRDRVDHFFAYFDQDNCKRVYDRIMELREES